MRRQTLVRAVVGLRGMVGLLAVAALAVAACSPSGTSWSFGPTAAPGVGPEGSGAPSAAPATPAASSAPSPSPSSGPGTPGGSDGPADTSSSVVRTEPCPDESRFECVTLAVARDHFAEAGGETWDVTYAIQRAQKERIGTFVVITGGPGTSGIAVADGYTDYYAPSITDAYDIVFMDQRGIGLSGPIACVDAAATYYRAPARAQDPDDREAVATAAQTFVTDCLAEAGVAEADLPLYASRQAIHDLEAIRSHLGIERMQLYGESYGTQFIQQYAATYPDRIETLFLDGPVDLTLDGLTYYTEAARSASDVLTATLAACNADETCVADVVGGDAIAAYDALAERLASGPILFDYPTASGTVEPRELTLTDLEVAAEGYFYSPFDRYMLTRAIASASHENYVPIARLAYDAVAIDAETLEAEESPDWSDAMYYAVECQDYAFLPDQGDPAARLDAWIAAGETAGINDLRLGSTYYGDIPCLYWPTATTDATRPEPLEDPPYPVVVLTSTTDPATPIAGGMSIFGRLDDAWFFQTVGGPHVIFAWGEPCPDEQMAAYLADGTPPPTRVTTCEGQVADDYLPIAPPTESGYEDALDLAATTDDQIFNTDDYNNRFEDESHTMGCDFGGTLTYAATDSGTSVTLTACEFTDGVPLTGSGATDDEAGSFEMDVTSGDGTSLHYERDPEGATSVTGTYDGVAVDLSSEA